MATISEAVGSTADACKASAEKLHRGTAAAAEEIASLAASAYSDAAAMAVQGGQQVRIRIVLSARRCSGVEKRYPAFCLLEFWGVVWGVRCWSRSGGNEAGRADFHRSGGSNVLDVFTTSSWRTDEKSAVLFTWRRQEQRQNNNNNENT